MFYYFRVIVPAVLSTSFFVATLQAQEGLPDTPSAPNKKAIENTLETAKKAIQPLKNTGDPKIQMLRERAIAAQNRKAELLEKIASGKIIPWQDFLNTQKQLLPSLDKIQLYTGNFHREQDADKKEILRQTIIELLQPVGPYLLPADYKRVDLTLSKAQVTELNTLQSANRYPENTGTLENMITPQNSTLIYTLTDFKVPLRLKAAPNTTLYLNAKGGGEFDNGISLQTVTTDNEGNAIAHWITRGDSSGTCLVEVTSPQAVNQVTYEIETVKLSFLPVPDATAYLKQLERIKETQQNPKQLRDKIKSTTLPNLK